MLFDSKGKVFGKVSIVDIIVIVLILFAIIGAYFRFSSFNSNIVSNDAEFYYTISIEGIIGTNKDQVVNSVGTDFRLGGKISSTMGQLVDVEVSDATKVLVKSDGTAVRATVPERYDVKMTLKVVGNVNDTGYFTPETHEICVGKTYNLTNKYCNVSGTVNKIWTK